MPSSSVYRGRFGSLIRAYGLVGYTPAQDYSYIETNRYLRRMHPEMVADVIAHIERLGGVVGNRGGRGTTGSIPISECN